MRTPGDSAMLCRFAHVQSVTFFAHAVVCTVILRRDRGSATFGPGHSRHARATSVEGAGGPRRIPGCLRAAAGPGRPRHTRATSAEGASGPRCIPGYLRAAAGPGRASRSTTPSRRLACGDLAGGPPPSGTKTGSPGQESTANPGGERADPTAPRTSATQPRPRRYRTRVRHSTEYRARSRL